jgi:hypothetical protein
MNHKSTIKLISNKYKVFGRDWWYAFRVLNAKADTAKATQFIASNQKLFSPIAKGWNSESNSEWVARCYLAGRLIMASTLYINTYRHCIKTNTRIVLPFLQYYAALFSMRACILTSPQHEWNNGALLSITHSKAINVSSDIVRSICPQEYSDKLKEKLRTLKAYRELISYIAPTDGDGNAPGLSAEDLIEMCTLLSEIAQLHSEILEGSITKHAPIDQKLEIYLEQIEHTFKATIEDFDFLDSADLYRLDYLRRKKPSVENVCHMITDGQAEDFFGAWRSTEDDESDSIFNSDNSTTVIFDIP